jgi:LysM repeat protein
MKNLLKKIILGTGVLAVSLAYAPKISQESLQSYQSSVIAKPYTEYQKLRNDNPRVVSVDYEIKKDDTFSKIADKYGHSLSDIIVSNSEKNPRDLQIGDHIRFKMLSNELQNYVLPTSMDNIQKNREYTQKLSNEEFKKLREKKGFEFIAYMNGIAPGEVEMDSVKINSNLEKIKLLLDSCIKDYNNIDFETFIAMGIVESGLNPFTISKTGSIGAWGNTLPTYGYDFPNNPFNLAEHINQSCKKYSNLKKMFGGSKKLAVISYNAGDSYAKKAIRNLAKKENIKDKKIKQIIRKLEKKNIKEDIIIKEMQNMNWTKYQRERITEGVTHYQRVQDAEKRLSEH